MCKTVLSSLCFSTVLFMEATPKCTSSEYTCGTYTVCVVLHGICHILLKNRIVVCSIPRLKRERENITKSKQVLVWKLFTPNICRSWGFFKASPVGLTYSYKTYIYIYSPLLLLYMCLYIDKCIS